MGILSELYTFRKTVIIILTPLLLIPLITCAPDDRKQEMKCAYTIILMAVYWIFEVLPLAVTSLLPLVFYPFFRISKAGEISKMYLKDTNVLFLGGLTVAVAVEHWNLHKRIALKVLTKVGAKPKWLLFGFMTTTAFLSMWISNVATTAMMIPIAQAVLHALTGEKSERFDDDTSKDSGRCTPCVSDENINNKKNPRSHLSQEIGNIGQAQTLGEELRSQKPDGSVKFNSNSPQNESYVKIPVDNNYLTNATDIDTPGNSNQALLKKEPTVSFNKKLEEERSNRGLGKALTICVCYAANIGGTATLTGTGPNLILVGQYKDAFPDAKGVDFGSWMVFAFPGMMLFLIFAWLWIQYLFLGYNLKELFTFYSKKEKSRKEVEAEKLIQRQYDNLGPVSYAEKSVLFFFTLLAFLWLTRNPGFVPGWGYAYADDKMVSDATTAIVIVVCLFIFPSQRPNFMCFRSAGDISPSKPVAPLLEWKVVQEKMAWGVILLLGGSFAMAHGSTASGLSEYIGEQLEAFSGINSFLVCVLCITIICLLTQCTSNTATATVFLPILATLGESIGVHPLYLMLPCTLMTSYAFMLPVSTPPNAIAYSYGYLSMMDMVKAGSVLNLVGVLACLFSVHLFGPVTFGTDINCPPFVNSTFCPQGGVLMNSTTPGGLIMNSTTTI